MAAAPPPAPELGQQTVEFSALVRRAAEDSYLSLKEIVDRSAHSIEERSDNEKKIDLLKFINNTRQRMLRLHVLSKWCNQVPVVHYCQQLTTTLSSHDTCFTQTADSLFYMHEGLQQARAPMFDVPSAIEVLLTGGYRRLPKCIEDIGAPSTLSEDEQKPALRKLDALLRSKLLEVSIPKEISEVKVADGVAILHVDGEFKIFLTLGYRGHLSMWRILHLELLVGEKCGPVKFEESQRFALGNDLEHRMAEAENPLMILYTILHELCIGLIMDTVKRQVQALCQGRWTDALRVEIFYDGNAGPGGSTSAAPPTQDGELDLTGQKRPGLKITYWFDKKNGGGSDSALARFIRIEQGQDLQIKCLHDQFVLDPFTDKEAEFSLDQSCIDVEKLVLRVIACSIHTRLLEIQRDLSKNTQICQASGDVILKREGDDSYANLRKDSKLGVEGHCGDEVLQVRAYGGSYISLGINIRNGRFLLQSSENILAQSALADCEEALNSGKSSAIEVFLSLRRKSILHLFASSARFLGLKVFEEILAALMIPKSILHGPDLLLVGFPQCGVFYYLLMQLDNDFKPVLCLLEAQPDPGGKSQSISDSNHVTRFNKINLGQMDIMLDDLNHIILDWDKLGSGRGACNKTSQAGLLPELGHEAPLQLSGCPQSSFSVIVDEVFELENGALAICPSQGHPFSSNISPTARISPSINNYQRPQPGVNSPKWDGGMQHSQMNNIATSTSGVSSTHGSAYLSNSLKSLHHMSVTDSLTSSSPARSLYMQKLPVSKSEQDLKSVKSPYLSEAGQFSAIDEDLSRQGNESSSGIRPTQLHTLRVNNPRLLSSSTKPDGSKNSSSGHLVGFSRDTSLSSFNGSTAYKLPEVNSARTSGSDDLPKHERTSGKRAASDRETMILSFHGSKVNSSLRKRRKISESANHTPSGSEAPYVPSCITSEYLHGGQLVPVTNEHAQSNVYVAVLLHLVRHCSLCIKHAQLTSQMDALEITYVEELDLQTPFSNLWFALPFARDDSWRNICLHLGKAGSMSWDVKINDPHFQELWELQKGSITTAWGCGVRIANASDCDSHINYNQDGVVLSYKSVEADSVQRLVSDLQRLSSARLFARGMRKLIGVKADNKPEDVNTNSDNKVLYLTKGSGDASDKLSEQVRRNFKIEAVGLMSLWFSYGSLPVMAHFVVEWEAGKEGCTMHVSPDHLWPHTKFLEDFVNGADVEPFLDCIRLTAGPLLALAAAIPPARTPGPVSAGPISVAKQNALIMPSLGHVPNVSSPSTTLPTSSANMGTITAPLVNHSLHNATATMLSATGRGGSGIFPSSLLPIDVSVVLRGPYWIRIIYRKKFAVDMRCFAGDQVWLQPATPPKGGPAAGGSLPCPQFRPFIMEHVAQGLNALEPNFPGTHAGGQMNLSNQTSGTQILPPNGNRSNVATSNGVARSASVVGSQVAGSVSRPNNTMLASSGISGVPVRISPGTVPVHVRGELNTAFIGLGDDGGYGGGWVPLAALKKVLRGILKYLGVLWLFAQLPDLLKEILGSILKENEGALLNLDQEQPALRFFVGGYVFAVSVHRVQLLLQVLSVKRFHHQPPPQQTQTNAQEELTPGEINEICDYFSRRVASEPYDASRVASFITLLTLPISVLREFLKLISWKKGLSQAHGGEIASAQRARVELCLENHSGSVSDENLENSSTPRSNIHHDRAHNSVDFALTFVLDPAHIPHINAAGGAAWLPYCASVRLRYSFGENINLSFLGMDGSHGGRACWLRLEDWEKCKQRMARTVEYVSGPTAGDISQGRLRLAAETLQRTLQVSLQQPRDGTLPSTSTGT